MYRLFVDPASISSGWALFRGKELISHGTIMADKKGSIFARLLSIYLGYRQLQLPKVEEVHIEQLPRSCHIYTHWSVGVIGLALTKFTLNVKGDVPVRSWQKHAKWDTWGGGDFWKNWPEYKSEDEYAAVCMGRWYVEAKI